MYLYIRKFADKCIRNLWSIIEKKILSSFFPKLNVLYSVLLKKRERLIPEKRGLQLQTKKDSNEKIRIPSKEWNVFVTQGTIDDIWGNLLASTENWKKRSHGDYTRAKKNYGVFFVFHRRIHLQKLILYIIR